jgi:Glycosyl transferase family 2
VARAFESLRSKLWPTRRLFEGALREVSQELAALRALGEELSAAQAGISARVDQIFDWQAEVHTRIRRTQALTARSYEALQGWPALLDSARREATYPLAYEELEPLISIPIPTRNSPDTLCDRALASVRAQTYANWEAIVVGDHCTDDTAARVQALDDGRIRFHNLAVREDDPDDPWERWAVRGSVPRSVGIELASGSWIAPLSHDDEWDPEHLEVLIAAARESRAEVVYSRMRVVDAEAPGRPITRSCGAWPPRLGEYAWQSAMFHGHLRFLRYDRACALASEPNDWNLARRAWEAGVRFQFVDRETSTLYLHDRWGEIVDQYRARGLPPSAAANS